MALPINRHVDVKAAELLTNGFGRYVWIGNYKFRNATDWYAKHHGDQPFQQIL